MLAALAARALSISGLAPAVLAAGLACVLLVTALALRAAARRRRLVLDAEGLWTIEEGGGGRGHRGRLLAAGYRDAQAVVLVIESACGVRRRVAVAADSVDARDFSFLHLALMLLADGAAATSSR